MEDRSAKPFLGYGSLLSRASAEQSFGPLAEFRCVRVSGYARVFNKVCVHSIRSGVADPRGSEIACACAMRVPGAELTAALIWIPASRAEGFFEREREFRVVEVEYSDLETAKVGRASLCTMWNDHDLRDSFANEEEYELEIGQHYAGKLWREDILPVRAYLRCCLEGARTLGIHERFLHETLLADGSRLDDFLKAHPEALVVPEAIDGGRYCATQEDQIKDPE